MSHPAYCRQCGNPLRGEDNFCGNCGAALLSPPPQAEQVISKSNATLSNTASKRKSVGWLMGVGFLAVLMLGGGVLIFGFGLFSFNKAPDPAFDLPLQALESRRTEAPILLPSELPNELQNIAVDEDLDGDSYGILFKAAPPDELVEPLARYNTVATFTAIPETEVESNDLFTVTSTEEVTLPDGTEAQLRRLEPVDEQINIGPYWEGTFNREGYVYTLSTFLGRDGEEVSQHVLSTMVEVTFESQ